jgi:hypothetical protein
MANEKNLKPFNKRTEKEQREIQKKGGIASGESRRKRKTLKEELLALLSDGDTQNRVSVALIEAALDGNVKAFETLRDTIGEKPVEKVEQVNIDMEYEQSVKYVNDLMKRNEESD